MINGEQDECIMAVYDSKNASYDKMMKELTSSLGRQVTYVELFRSKSTDFSFRNYIAHGDDAALFSMIPVGEDRVEIMHSLKDQNIPTAFENAGYDKLEEKRVNSFAYMLKCIAYCVELDESG